MSKKGFTLIELIAVVVILALIALIVFPAITSVVNSSKEKTYKNQQEQIIKAAKECAYENTEILPENTNESVNLPLKCLTTGCTLNGVYIAGGYITNDDKNGNITDPRNTKKYLEGQVVITNVGKQYTYKYSEGAKTTATIGDKILDNDSALKANGGIYKGLSNVNNYVRFNGNTTNWRIIKVNGDGTLTLIQEKSTVQTLWNASATTFESSSINTYLNSTFYNSFAFKAMVVPSAWCVGEYGNECNTTVKANVGLLSTYDYRNASNDTRCQDDASYCNQGNYLSTQTSGTAAEYTMTFNSSNDKVYTIKGGKIDGTTYSPNSSLPVRPVITVKASSKINSGNGTSGQPYIIS